MTGQDSDAVRRLFGLVLRHLRRQAGLSLRDLGERSLYDYSRISRVERGEHLIDPELVPSLDQALNANGLLISLRALISTNGTPAEMPPAGLIGGFPIADGDSVTVEFRLSGRREARVSLSRREFHRLMATGAFGGALRADLTDTDLAERVSRAVGEPQRTDPQVLDYFRTLLEQHFVADKMLGPRALLGQVHAQIEILDGLRRGGRPGTSESTLRLLARYAEFAGWLHQDCGDVASAIFWSDRATQWAQAIGDQPFVAYLLVRRSNIAMIDRDGVDVVELAAAAQRVPGPISPRLRALAAQQEARGWAMHGDADSFRVRLDVAADLLHDHPDGVDENAPVYLHRYDLAALEEQSATGYRDCGHADTAVAILERRIADTPAHLQRDQAHQWVKLANAVLKSAQPDPERAAALGLRCVSAARTTGSARIVGELRTLSRTLSRRWPDLCQTEELRDALATV
ncbi:helix-turn-helix domain-containing protein [Catellatospora sichuanensis]|uniref:helix-turn-helix domain-containing protein n=1 Tax=Catellatospora sichuanensis TaxID=1969805 RepID=UPI001183C74B|nr:helix-turn-helix transcriptional regulator [Catellatospora sichuanensis]